MSNLELRIEDDRVQRKVELKESDLKNRFDIVEGDIWISHRLLLKIVTVNQEKQSITYHGWSEHSFEFYKSVSGDPMSFERLLKDYERVGAVDVQSIIADGLAISKDGILDLSMSTDMSTDTSVMSTNSKQMLIVREEQLRTLASFARLQKHKLDFYIESVKHSLSNLRSELSQQVSKLNEYLTEVRKTIRNIELYLGIDEELVQIRNGSSASVNEPLSFRQLLLFMNEEIALQGDEWIDADINDVEQFDTWLLENDRYLAIAPEQKCVVAFRYRRSNKEYGETTLNATMSYWNSRTFILIRNGEQLYRIFTENISVVDRLFPRRSEFTEFLDGLDDVNAKLSSWDKDRLKTKKDRYLAQAMFLQGLIDRTDVFHPLPSERLNIFKTDEASDMIRLIYDEEDVLSDGRQRFRDWQKTINQDISEGSRVITSGYRCVYGEHRRYYRDRFKRWYNEHNMPSFPKGGLYQVYGEDDKLYIRYKAVSPYSWTDTESKNRTSWQIFKDDEELLNYDAISLEDVEYYLRNRIDRPSYLKMLPVLLELKKRRLAEIEWEKHFVQLIIQETNGKYSKDKIWSVIDWWKLKNKWKRPIRANDELALRMIRKRLAC